VDKQNKPQQTSEEEVTPAAPAGQLQARSPYRPLSRRKRQDQIPEAPPAVERPTTTMKFDASPTTVSAALARVGAAEEPVLAWRPDATDELDVEVEIEEPEAEG
jgi:hypothetical protein